MRLINVNMSDIDKKQLPIQPLYNNHLKQHEKRNPRKWYRVFYHIICTRLKAINERIETNIDVMKETAQRLLLGNKQSKYSTQLKGWLGTLTFDCFSRILN